MRRRVVAATIAVVGLCAVGASVAGAADPVPLNGSPLNVYVGERGQLQAFRTGQTSGIYYPDDSTTGDAGFFLAVLDSPNTVYGFNGHAGPHGTAEYVTVSGPAATGSGTAADPLTQRTVYKTAASNGLEVTQTTTYVNGSQFFTVQWAVRNTAATAAHFKAFTAADFFFDGSDRGTGIYTQGPPQFIGGTNADTGNSGGFAEVPGTTAWSKYQALAYGGAGDQVWGKIDGAAANPNPTFDNSVVGDQVDNAGGVEWDTYATTTPLGAGATATFSLVARSAVPSALQINPPNAGSPRGVPINFTVGAFDTNGTPYAGKTIRYAITGANPGGGVATTDAAGNAVLTDTGALAGADTLVAFLDFNNDGTRQPVEPQASALATFVDNVAPACKVKVSGDRPGGSGGAGKPLIISVNCNEAATVTVQTTLQPRSSRTRAATVDKKKPKKKKVTIKLKTSTVTVAPGQAVPVSLKLSSAVRKKYAGKTLTATITVTARDASGNVKKTKATRTVKLAKLKKSKAHKRR
ncbi:MAG TPA: hypothetical protein VFY32_00675 [Solirubrobacteraceae bacterium]|nr:hypothetical protein [Solirubrobacteraceae bacterium]